MERNIRLNWQHLIEEAKKRRKERRLTQEQILPARILHLLYGIHLHLTPMFRKYPYRTISRQGCKRDGSARTSLTGLHMKAAPAGDLIVQARFLFQPRR